MGLFGNKNKQLIADLMKENKELRAANRSKDRRISELVDLCERKDNCFKEAISDGLRHGSKIAAWHMSDINRQRKGK